MIYMKKHTTENGEILALCDEELLGKVFSEGNRELDLNLYSDFYKGDIKEEKEAESEIFEMDISSANVVGDRSVSIFINNRIAKNEEVMRIGDIPFIQIYKIKS